MLVVSAPTLVYLGARNVADRAEWETPTDGIRWEQKSEGVFVAGGRLPVEVEAGYALLDISGVPVRTLDEHAEILEALIRPGDSSTVVDYTFLAVENGRQITAPVRIEWKSPLEAVDLALLLVAGCFLFVGTATYLRGPNLPGSFHFAVLCLIAYCLLAFRYSGRADLFDLAVYWISAIAFLLLPPVLVHFCRKFPVTNSAGFGVPAVLLYLPACVLGLVHLQWFLGRFDLVGFARTSRTASLLDRVELGHFLVGIALASYLLWRTYRRCPGVVEKKQLQWVAAGATLGFVPFTLLYVIPFLLNWRIAVWMEASVLSVALVPLSLSYAVARFRPHDVRLYFKRGVALVLASSALLATFVLFVAAILRVLGRFAPEANFLVLGALAVAVAVLFDPLRRWIQDRLDRHYYRERYGYRRSLLDFGRSLSAEIQLEAILERVVDRLDKALNVPRVAVFLQDGENPRRFRLVWEPGGHLVPREFGLTEVELEQLAQPRDPADWRGTDLAQLRDPLREKFADAGLRYLEPLRVRQRVIGFLALAAPRDEELLSSEDLELLAALTEYAAIALDNARLYASLEGKARELFELRAYAENVIESIRLGVAVVDIGGRITVWNSSMVELLGVGQEKALGEHVESVVPRPFLEALRKVTDGPHWLVSEVTEVYRALLPRPDGDRLVNVTLAPFLTEASVNTGTLILVDDVTEKVRLEAQLLQAERLSSIGIFAAGIAHEVNTPLAAISSYAQILLEETPKEDSRWDLLEKIERQSFRASEILNNLLKFARSSERDFEEVSLNSVLLDTLGLVEHQLRKDAIEVEVDLDPGLPKTVGNGGKLAQVFMNLLMNARDAMPEGGRLRLVTRRQDSELMVRVEDTGAGISREDLRRIYDPFFTTKEVGKGVGLGLAVTYGIIQEHAGRIDVDSEPGKGTVFSLYLPARRIH